VPQKPKEAAPEGNKATPDAQADKDPKGKAPEGKATPDASAVPEVTVQQISEPDRQVLADIFGLTVAGQLLDLDQAIQLGTHDKKSPPMKLGSFERAERGRIHGVSWSSKY
jgi:hypothetical protein